MNIAESSSQSSNVRLGAKNQIAENVCHYFGQLPFKRVISAEEGVMTNCRKWDRVFTT
jgi:hypothetical protein